MMKQIQPSPFQPFDKRNLVIRVSTAVVFAVFFLGLLSVGDRVWAPWVFLGLMAFGMFAGIREMTLLGQKMGANPSLVTATLVAWGILAHFFLAKEILNPLPLWMVLSGGMILIHVGALFFDRALEKALLNQAVTWMGALALGFGLGFQQKIFMLQGSLPKTGSRLILALYIIVWLGDSVAYFVGSFWGKRKLAPRVSPKKTWEGVLGNYLGNLGGAFLMKAMVCSEWSAVDCLVLGLLLGTAGQLGDLVESTWKRSANVKDSFAGVSIPGHGGMLDRIDSLLFAAPVMYGYLYFVHGFN